MEIQTIRIVLYIKMINQLRLKIINGVTGFKNQEKNLKDYPNSYAPSTRS